MHLYAWEDTDDRWYVARACSTTRWFSSAGGDTVAKAYYLDAYGPHVVIKLRLGMAPRPFDVFVKGNQIAQAFNSHAACLFDGCSWRAGVNHVIRAPTAHMGYPDEEAGSAPYYGFTSAWVAWKENRVQSAP